MQSGQVRQPSEQTILYSGLEEDSPPPTLHTHTREVALLLIKEAQQTFISLEAVSCLAHSALEAVSCLAHSALEAVSCLAHSALEAVSCLAHSALEAVSCLAHSRRTPLPVEHRSGRNKRERAA